MTIRLHDRNRNEIRVDALTFKGDTLSTVVWRALADVDPHQVNPDWRDGDALPRVEAIVPGGSIRFGFVGLGAHESRTAAELIDSAHTFMLHAARVWTVDRRESNALAVRAAELLALVARRAG